MRRLPHLNGIRAFEAAARSGSFAAAATELHVSPAAISRMVRLFEERLGVPLFEREANRLTLTAAGRAYQIGLAPILDALAQLTDQIKAQPTSRVLTIGVGPTFAIRWLIPRLSAFRDVAPDIDVRLTTGGVAAPFADDWTCGIKLGDGQWPGLVAERLFGADLIPVCAPRVAKRLKKPGDLDSGALLRVAHARADWPLWLKAAGLNAIAAKGADVRILRTGAAGRERRARRRARHPPLHRRRHRGRKIGDAVQAVRSKRQRMVFDLSRVTQERAGVRDVSHLDGRDGGEEITRNRRLHNVARCVSVARIGLADYTLLRHYETAQRRSNQNMSNGLPGFFTGTGMPDPGWWEALWPNPAAVLSAVGVSGGQTVVDLCSGDGWFTVQIAKIAHRVIAVDIDATLLEMARIRLSEAGINNCVYVTGDAYDLADVIREKVDHVFLANVFHGVPDKPRLCRAVRSVLKPGGLFAIVNWHAQPREHTKVLGQPRGPATELRMTPEQTTASAESEGFKLRRVVEVSPYHYGTVFEAAATQET